MSTKISSYPGYLNSIELMNENLTVLDNGNKNFKKFKVCLDVYDEFKKQLRCDPRLSSNESLDSVLNHIFTLTNEKYDFNLDQIYYIFCRFRGSNIYLFVDDLEIPSISERCMKLYFRKFCENHYEEILSFGFINKRFYFIEDLIYSYKRIIDDVEFVDSESMLFLIILSQYKGSFKKDQIGFEFNILVSNLCHSKKNLIFGDDASDNIFNNLVVREKFKMVEKCLSERNLSQFYVFLESFKKYEFIYLERQDMFQALMNSGMIEF